MPRLYIIDFCKQLSPQSPEPDGFCWTGTCVSGACATGNELVVWYKESLTLYVDSESITLYDVKKQVWYETYEEINDRLKLLVH